MSLIEKLKQFDIDLFFSINGCHNNFFDNLMLLFSNKIFWIPIYVLILFLLYKKFNLKSFLLVIVLTATCITLADQISVHFFKNTFLRYRPCHNETYGNMVHLVDKCGGKYGFVSSHAANFFSIAVFLGLILRKKIKYIFPLLIVWAILIGYSRIYLGRHYPSDVMAGALLGTTIGIIMYFTFILISKKFNLQA